MKTERRQIRAVREARHRIPRVKNTERTLREHSDTTGDCTRCGKTTPWVCAMCGQFLCLLEEDHFE